VLDRPKLPPNNIISGDNALKTHGIWTQTISGSNSNTHNAGPATHGPTLTRQHFTPRTNDAVTRGGCKKCGAGNYSANIIMIHDRYDFYFNFEMIIAKLKKNSR
jgi:hypothetical protein